MVGIRIRDLTAEGYLAFDLSDLLNLLGPPAIASHWVCRGLWCTSKDPPQGTDLEQHSDTGQPIAGAELARLAAGTRQVIDGTLEAVEPGEKSPWLVLQAVDSTYWEVYSDDANALACLRTAFHDVEDLPDDAA